MIRIVILGSGNVAYSLAKAVAKSELDLVQIYARNIQEGSYLAEQCNCKFTSDIEQLEPADLYIISVNDRSIEQLARKIKAKDSVVAHTAGSVAMDVLAASTKNYAVIYPLQTFTKGRDMDFEHIPIMIEGSTTHAKACARLFAERISKNVLEVDSEARKVIHLSAVFTCNFVNHMYVIGERLVESHNLSFDLLKPLIEETTRKALEVESPVLTQTGPALRNDYQTKAVHCDMLMQQPELKTMYINLSNSIWETSKKK